MVFTAASTSVKSITSHRSALYTSVVRSDVQVHYWLNTADRGVMEHKEPALHYGLPRISTNTGIVFVTITIILTSG